MGRFSLTRSLFRRERGFEVVFIDPFEARRNGGLKQGPHWPEEPDFLRFFPDRFFFFPGSSWPSLEYPDRLPTEYAGREEPHLRSIKLRGIMAGKAYEGLYLGIIC